LTFGTLPRAPVLQEGSFDVPLPKALGRRPIIGEGTEASLAPAAEARARTVFEVTGFILILLMALAAAWILIRKRI
jgi:hypothetical protein